MNTQYIKVKQHLTDGTSRVLDTVRHDDGNLWIAHTAHNEEVLGVKYPHTYFGSCFATGDLREARENSLW